MGQSYSTNDFQLVAECSTELENMLKNEFGASGNGLGAMCNSVSIPTSTRCHISYVGKVRNKKLHEDTNIDRQEFIHNFEEARDGLRALATNRANKANPPISDGKETSSSLSGGLVIGGLLAAGAIAFAASKMEDSDREEEQKLR